MVVAGAIGLYLGLTGKRLSAPKDLLYSGLGTHHVRVEQLPSLRDALVREPLARHSDKAETLRQLDGILQKFQVPLWKCVVEEIRWSHLTECTVPWAACFTHAHDLPVQHIDADLRSIRPGRAGEVQAAGLDEAHCKVKGHNGKCNEGGTTLGTILAACA